MGGYEVDKWKDITCNRFITFIDIMGFKDFVARSTHEDVEKTLSQFIETFDTELITLMTKDQKVTFDESLVKPIIFSDSIILMTKDESLESAASLIIYTQWIVSMALLHTIPFKGAIAFGLITADMDRSLYFGQPIIDSFQLQEELDIYGVVLHNTAEKYLLDKGYMNVVQNTMNNTKIPMKKSGKVTHYIVNPFIIEEPNSHEEPYKNIIIEYYKKVSGSTRHYVDNTSEFLNWLVGREAKKK